MSALDRSPSIAPPARRRWWLPRVLAAGAMAVMVGGVAAAVVSSPAAAATVDTSAWYVLVNRNSGKALDVYNLSTADGARITQWTRNDGNQQQWQFVDSGSGYYRLKSRQSGKVLDVSSFSTADGAAIVQWTDNNGTNQQFRLPDSTRLRPADQPQQRQGRRGAGRLHRRRRQRRPVRRLERHQPAVAARPRRRHHRRTTPPPSRLVHPAVDLPVDLHRLAGHPEVGLGVAQGLHHRSRTTASTSSTPRRTTPGQSWGSMNFSLFTNWSDMASASQNAMSSGDRRAVAVLLRPEEHLGAHLPVGWRRPFSYRTSSDPTNPNGWSVAAAAVHRQHHRLRHRPDRPDPHRRRHEHVPVLRRRQRQDLPGQHADRELPGQLRLVATPRS